MLDALLDASQTDDSFFQVDFKEQPAVSSRFFFLGIRRGYFQFLTLGWRKFYVDICPHEPGCGSS